VILCSLACGQATVVPFITSQPQFFDRSGNPLAFGCLFTYAAGTSTPKATYTDSTGTVPQANPIILDSSGSAPAGTGIWMISGLSYKFVLVSSGGVKCASGTLIASQDNLSLTLNGPGPGAAVFKTNDVTNSIQNVLNLKSGTNTTVSASGGDVTINATIPAATVLKTNGVTNPDQTVLNLIPGTNIGLSPAGGAVTVNNTAVPPVFKTGYVTNADQAGLNLVAGSGIILTVSGNTVTIAAVPCLVTAIGVTCGGTGIGLGNSGYLGTTKLAPGTSDDLTGSLINKIVEDPPQLGFWHCSRINTTGPAKMELVNVGSGEVIHVWNLGGTLNGLASSCTFLTSSSVNTIDIPQGHFAVFIIDGAGNATCPGLDIQP
jgi:hypothetical protein